MRKFNGCFTQKNSLGLNHSKWYSLLCFFLTLSFIKKGTILEQKYGKHTLIRTLFTQIEDARAAMMLYMKKKREWEKNVKDLVKMKLKQKKRKPKKHKKEESSLAS